MRASAENQGKCSPAKTAGERTQGTSAREYNCVPEGGDRLYRPRRSRVRGSSDGDGQWSRRVANPWELVLPVTAYSSRSRDCPVTRQSRRAAEPAVRAAPVDGQQYQET